MNRITLALASTVWMLSSCASFREVVVVNEMPVGCKSVGTVEVAHDAHLPPETSIPAMRLKTRELGGNTMQCCGQGLEGSFDGVNPRTGEGVGFTGYILSGEAYYCKAGRGKPSQ